MSEACPCGSGKSYERCCKPFHQGTLCKSSLQLMKARYSAYAKAQVFFLIQSTHPECVQTNRLQWVQELQDYCAKVQFTKLQIIQFKEEKDRGWVHFKAFFTQGIAVQTLEEKSLFHRLDGKWLYHSGELL